MRPSRKGFSTLRAGGDAHCYIPPPNYLSTKSPGLMAIHWGTWQVGPNKIPPAQLMIYMPANLLAPLGACTRTPRF